MATLLVVLNSAQDRLQAVRRFNPHPASLPGGARHRRGKHIVISLELQRLFEVPRDRFTLAVGVGEWCLLLLFNDLNFFLCHPVQVIHESVDLAVEGSAFVLIVGLVLVGLGLCETLFRIEH